MDDRYKPPYCSACGLHIDDLDSNHHVCVSGPGGVIAMTRDEAYAEWKRKDDEHQAAEAAKAEGASPRMPP